MNEKDFDRLIESVKQVGLIRKGKMAPGRVFVFSPIDIKALRSQLNKSQIEFALMIGVSVGTLRNWEQGRRFPVGPAQALLRAVQANPKAVLKALSS